MRQTLSQADVQRLLTEKSAEARNQAASKIAADYRAEILSDEERRIAEDILRAMARDVEVQVRRALASNLKDYPGLSRDIALALARDVESVSLPVLRCSVALTDADLIEIVRTQGPAKQTAVACRATVSEPVADALVENGDEEVVSALVANDGAAISEQTFQKVIDAFGDSERVTDGMVGRRRLPVSVAERLVNLVSERLREQIVARHDLPAGVATDLILQSRERATLGLLTPQSDRMDLGDLVAHLHASGRLTPSIILRALCMGDIAFFEAAAAELGGVTLENARMLIHDEGPLGLPAIMERAGLPESLRPVFRAAIEVSNETEYDGLDNDRTRFRRRMIERILTYMEDPSGEMGADNAEYLLSRLCGLDGAFSMLNERAGA